MGHGWWLKACSWEGHGVRLRLLWLLGFVGGRLSLLWLLKGERGADGGQKTEFGENQQWDDLDGWMSVWAGMNGRVPR